MAPNIQSVLNLLVLLVIISKVSANTPNGSNLALGKTAIQSSNYLEYTAGKAVDGNTSGYFQEDSCSHTYQYSRNVSEWWEVDLGSVYDITDIIIYNRIDCCELTFVVSDFINIIIGTAELTIWNSSSVKSGPCHIMVNVLKYGHILNIYIYTITKCNPS
ncbi:hypothetical protein LOTGIDRAFT_160858 [Lottia gigantea]|uniref:Fucolectin tachylectin-4 pentraxin-1 domain-containing protein n=1 Tax=Lottia gigantea TaxID=225164 RepID=V4AE00_LOTGI|nr:hypothetical protein LOTGIDRAFT_160858 [Lottia gigantea]ESO95097.1 hypothetical protein LOTGIDRAFT_160858 [Lottia gigantea]